MSLRTTASRPGIDWSAAVAAASAGCWYALAEMPVRRRAMGSLTCPTLVMTGRMLDSPAHFVAARLRSPVGVIQPALQSGEPPLVDHMEEVERAHVLLARRELDRLAVVARLRLAVRRRHDLGARVAGRLLARHVGLDAVLAVDDRQFRSGLRCPVERPCEQRDELAVVGDPDRRRMRMAKRRRDLGRLAVDVDREL